MRLRFGVVLCLFALVWGAACRKPLTPNVDRNLAPETWITAAPMDTITLRDSNGKVLPPDPSVHVIPVRFHMYWAGSDPDGAVVGFYYAVTETTSVPEPGTGRLPELPGPRPHDYRYTTRTDTTFIFNVTEGSPDRQHAFFLYAVDNQGKPDPTPARFLFTAIDKYPACPILMPDSTYAAGTVYGLDPSGMLVSRPDTTYLSDTSSPVTLPRDTAAVNAKLNFKWHVRLGIAGSFVRKYCWRLEEPGFVCSEDPSLSLVTYPGPFSAGLKVFTIRAVDEAQGVCDSTRRFILNYMPDTWYSGPDPHDARSFVQTPDITGDRYYFKDDLSDVDIKTWPGIPGTMMGVDSFKVLPLHRPRRKTFFEIWNHRIYAHFENDTVHMNSWVLFYNGGYDKDSQYRVRVDPIDPELPADTASNPVILPRPENGSPIGFRSQVVLTTDIRGQPSNFTQTGLYPIFQPTSVFRATHIGVYWPMFLSGKAFALVRAEDGDGQTDVRVGDPRALAELVDGHGGTTAEQELREREVMTFFVNKSPFLDTLDFFFKPKLNGSTTFTGPVWDLDLPADDVDPLDPAAGERQYGVPTTNKVLRYKVEVLGKDLQGKDLIFVYDPGGFYSPYYFNDPTPRLIVPPNLAGGPVKIRVELCDCVDCEHISGQGRCVSKVFDATYVPTALAVPGASLKPDRGRAH